ncbi:MAG: DUF4292 domain-containing protein [Bacteroidales bacterium]|nr:DUF4292 domain-containing protein [Bacteroidales bacterium]
MMKKAKYILSMLALAGMLASCGAHKAAVNDTPKYTLTDTAKKAESTPQVSHVTKIANSFGAWTTLRAGGSVSIGGTQSLSSSMQIRMERGKSIYISVRPMGIMEVGRLIITGDTLLVIDKLHKRYILEDAKLLTAGIPINVSTLQDIFLGRAFILGKGTFNSGMSSMVTFANVDGSYMIRPKEQYKGFEYDFKFDKNYHIKSLEVIPATSTNKVTTYSVDYSDVKTSLAGQIATKVKVATQINRSSVSLALEYSGYTWNEEVTIDTKIPENYTRVSGSSLLGMFSVE